MASTPTVLLSISDYGKGIAYEEQRIVLDGGTTAAVFIPSSASKITTIRQICPVNETAANAFKVVKTYVADYVLAVLIILHVFVMIADQHSDLI